MLLAVDTSTAQIGLALYDESSVLGELLWHTRAHHTAELAPAVHDLLTRTGATMKDIRALGVALGPGSFTSLRVGLAFVKGLSLARCLPLIGIPTLDILAAAQPPSDLPLAAVLQAGRGRLAVVWYQSTGRGWQAQGEPLVSTAEDLAAHIESPTLVCGELTGEERQRLRKNRQVRLAAPAACVRRPSVLAELARARWQAGQVDSAAA
ncbi:MAG: tRNA (adenosine(37)-N6)-threonylcarbamoyltransferase complex dimerization subunit type 1 TsaB, partial [Anaerolineales bacterium]